MFIIRSLEVGNYYTLDSGQRTELSGQGTSCDWLTRLRTQPRVSSPAHL